jgi:DNA-binding XRE family transcriptional regulator
MLTLPSGATAYAPHPGARVAFLLTESEAAKCGLLERWQAAVWRREQRKQKQKQAKRVAFLTLNENISRLLTKADQEEWSQRKLAGLIGIAPRTFRRIRSNQVNPFIWLPKIESAAFRLTR